MKINALATLTFLLAAFATAAQAEEGKSESKISPLLSPDEVENQITLDRETNPLYESKLFGPIKEWRNGVA
ncbi:MAG: hypothetical protein AB1Z51_14230, partial [Desulfuromonadales bacterium]